MQRNVGYGTNLVASFPPKDWVHFLDSDGLNQTNLPHIYDDLGFVAHFTILTIQWQSKKDIRSMRLLNNNEQTVSTPSQIIYAYTYIIYIYIIINTSYNRIKTDPKSNLRKTNWGQIKKKVGNEPAPNIFLQLDADEQMELAVYRIYWLLDTVIRKVDNTNTNLWNTLEPSSTAMCWHPVDFGWGIRFTSKI